MIINKFDKNHWFIRNNWIVNVDEVPTEVGVYVVFHNFKNDPIEFSNGCNFYCTLGLMVVKPKPISEIEQWKQKTFKSLIQTVSGYHEEVEFGHLFLKNIPKTISSKNYRILSMDYDVYKPQVMVNNLLDLVLFRYKRDMLDYINSILRNLNDDNLNKIVNMKTNVEGASTHKLLSNQLNFG